MVIVHSYVKLPEGKPWVNCHKPSKIIQNHYKWIAYGCINHPQMVGWWLGFPKTFTCDTQNLEMLHVVTLAQTRLVGGLEQFLFSHILGIIISIDELIFFRGVETTNQIVLLLFSEIDVCDSRLTFSSQDLGSRSLEPDFVSFHVSPKTKLDGRWMMAGWWLLMVA